MTKEKRQSIIAVNYLGGYNDTKKMAGTLSFYESYVKFSAFFKDGIEIQLSDITAVSVEAPEEVGRRVTATRLITLGVLSLFLKKATRESFIVLDMKDGSEVIFQVNGLNQVDVRAKLSSVLSKVKATA